jgi:DEAD/DEAH box helicase domain-containing protein
VSSVSPPASGGLLARLSAAPGRRDRLTHVEQLPARAGTALPWPSWVPGVLVEHLARVGVTAPWAHQVQAATHAHEGRSVVVATGTASGKSLAYLLPALTAVLDGTRAPNGRGATALYVAPTKALAGDQLRVLAALDLATVRAATFDGDTPGDERAWVRDHAAYVLTNPDMLHRTVLPGHSRWGAFLRVLRYVVIDECHTYRGVFGSHVAQVLRRLRRICARYGADPVFVLTSATVSAP